MRYGSMLSSSQKITMLRQERKARQEDLAAALGCTKSRISKIEKGEWDYSEEDIKAAKKFFGIEKAPFTEGELLVFKQHLYKLRDVIKNGLIEKAKEHQKDLKIIKELPFEADLQMLYRMFDIRLALKEMNVALAEEMLLAEKAGIENACGENRHHFYFNMGSLNFIRNDFKTALQYYLKARELEAFVLVKDVALLINLAICYSSLGKYALSISLREEAKHNYDFHNTNMLAAYSDSSLAINYVRIGQIAKAKQLLENCLLKAMGFGDKVFTGAILHNYACAHLKANEREKALEYFNQAFEYFNKGDRFYLESMYWKARCLIADKKTLAKGKVLIAEAKSLAKENEHYTIAFESLAHSISLNDDKSLEYIEKKTIPYFIEKYEYFRVLHYCELLENLFIKRGKGYKIRALEMTAIVRSIIKEIAFGEEVTIL